MSMYLYNKLVEANLAKNGLEAARLVLRHGGKAVSYNHWRERLEKIMGELVEGGVKCGVCQERKEIEETKIKEMVGELAFVCKGCLNGKGGE